MNLEDKIDKLCDTVVRMDKQLAIYNLQLGEHMRRTELLEHEVKILANLQHKVLGAFILAQILIPFILKFF